MGVRREVAWPRDVAALARSLSREGAWCWLDGGSPAADAQGRSYLAAASGVRVAERGREREFLAGLRRSDGGPEAVAFDDGFSGGWVTALSYEFGVALLGLEPAPDAEAPAFALRIETVLVLDHAAGTAELRGRCEDDLDEWLVRHGAALEGADSSPVSGIRTRSEIRAQSDGIGLESPTECGSPTEGAAGARGGAAAAWRRSPWEYRAQVEECRASIRDGEAYVLCLTDTAEVRGAYDPLELYLRLRGGHPAARGGVLQAGDRALVSTSPERFLSVRGERVSTHPIKGTRPRGRGEEEDRRLAAELAADPKERAENLMIVDLMRNDLSRVCVPGTVAVEGFLRVESHPHVHQLVSTVSGRIAPGCDAVDAIEAGFPGGSMTGAPKHRAVEILAGLEGGSRGLYSGCFGWLSEGGAELAMTIRGVELRGIGTPEPVALVGSGGGVTADSDAGSEYREKQDKAAPILRALGAG